MDKTLLKLMNARSPSVMVAAYYEMKRDLEKPSCRAKVCKGHNCSASPKGHNNMNTSDTKIKKNSKTKTYKYGGRAARVIYCRLDPALDKPLQSLRHFYGHKRLNDILPLLVTTNVLDIAARSPDKNWSSTVVKAYKNCVAFREEFTRAFWLLAVKKVLQKEKPDVELSLAEMSLKVKKELDNVIPDQKEEEEMQTILDIAANLKKVAIFYENPERKTLLRNKMCAKTKTKRSKKKA